MSSEGEGSLSTQIQFLKCRQEVHLLAPLPHGTASTVGMGTTHLQHKPRVLPLRFLALLEPRTLLPAPVVGVRVFPKQRNEHTRQHKTRQTWRPPRMARSALFYTVVCGMLPSHKTHCCFSDLSLTFWIFKMFTHKPAPRVCCLQLAPLSSLFARKEHPASFARAGLIGNVSFAST